MCIKEEREKRNNVVDASENENENRDRKYCDDKQNLQLTCDFTPKKTHGSGELSYFPKDSSRLKQWERESENEGVKQRMFKKINVMRCFALR